MLNILSLFDGMSCGQLALNRIGIRDYTYYASEIDKNAIKVTQKNFPNTIQLGDVLKIGVGEGGIDLLIGGSPCQGFSFAGKGLNFEDERSKLFFEYVRILKESKPKYFLLENVKMKKEWENIITDILFGISPVEINSNLVSAGDRKRLYWVGERQLDGTYKQLYIPNIEDKQIKLESIIEENVDEEYYLTEKQIKTRIYGCGAKNMFGGRLNNGRDKAYTLLASYCKTGGNGGKWKDEKGVRTFTVSECEKLQTVPVGYTDVEGITTNQKYHMLGNGWTVDIISHIFSCMNIFKKEN